MGQLVSLGRLFNGAVSMQTIQLQMAGLLMHWKWLKKKRASRTVTLPNIYLEELRKTAKDLVMKTNI
jgi:hypothetical protein